MQTEKPSTMENKRFTNNRSPGTGHVFAVPDSNDWYLTTDDSIVLGPYGSCQEAVRLLGLLRERSKPAPPGKGLRTA